MSRALRPAGIQSFPAFLQEVVESPPRALERWWAHRFFLLGGDLPLDAPADMGKTTFALALAAHLARTRHARVMVVAPTALLLEQMRERPAAMGAPEPLLPAARGAVAPKPRSASAASVRRWRW
ncbi:Reverse gyrase [bacterium HR39]|nr:Reverse gyrase [bacterium HR39]